MSDLIERQDTLGALKASCLELGGSELGDGEMGIHKDDIEVVVNSVPSTNQWILCSEKMPEEHEWVGTKKFGTTISDEVHVTFEAPNGDRFVKTLSFQNGELSAFEQRVIDTWHGGSKPIAWMPLPEPYEEKG